MPSSSDSVKVAVRVRPFNQREKNAGSKCVLSMNGSTTVITNPENNDKKTFSFDHSYWSHDSSREDENGVFVPDSSNSNYADQRRVFSDLGQGVLDNAWQGYNAALFAYGQTGAGKSYSMIGYGPNKGIVPITCEELFKAIEDNQDKTKQLQVSFSMLEIYNEQVRDLLVKTKPQAGGLKIRQNPQTGFYVEGLKQVPVRDYNEIEKLMEQGTVNRTTASTNMNATSSRSHMVITIRFAQVFKNADGQSNTRSSDINLVDLAGSERADSTGATGDRLKEGSAINQSLSTLGNVISALADLAMGKKKVLVPYRDSVLTKLLQSALGGNSRTIMIAALSPADINYDETLSTLRYADRAKKIQNKAVVNESPTDRLIRELKEENAKLLEALKKQGGVGRSDDLRHLLEENEKKMQSMTMTWEQRLEEARISDNHARIENTGSEVTLEPLNNAKIYVNGHRIHKKIRLENLSRLKFGSSCLFLHVGLPSERKQSDNIDRYDYDYFMMELADHREVSVDLHSQGVYESNDNLNHMRVFQEYMDLIPQISEANAISEELKKGIKFEPEIKSQASHDAKVTTSNKEVIIRVSNPNTKKVWIWSKIKFLHRKDLMDEMYVKWLDSENVHLPRDKDPFWDPVEDIFLGSCHVLLQSLSYCVDTDEHFTLHNYHGKEEAVMQVQIYPSTPSGDYIGDESIVEPKELVGKRFDFVLKLPQCMGVRWTMEDNSRGIYCKSQFRDQAVVKTKTVWGKSYAELGFKHQFTVKKIDMEFIRYLQSHNLVLELWGTQVNDEVHKGHRNGATNGEEEADSLKDECESLKKENFKLKQTVHKQKEAVSLQKTKKVSQTKETPPKNGNLKAALEKQEKSLDEVSHSLSSCVGALKESVANTLKKAKS
ncbi:hypothetical protein FSP39_001728 [Pinctada imbricata]|uniref:Kinesin-like protein n=1 Tax=Pinctada imbricata TaxID=66713 RepID=A0AA89BS91_PINIB|nr:hypothetical protein FSP39_001728 [Pinctada imbricata]